MRSRCPLCNGEKLENLQEFRRVELVACNTCHAVSTLRIPTQRELEAHYSTAYSRSRSFNSPISIQRRDEILSTFEPYRESGRLLDIGCGDSLFLDQARERGWVTFGTEFTQNAVELGEAHSHQMHLGVLQTAKYPSNHFDVLIYTEVIEHIDNHCEELAEMFRILRPGGYLYITTPNFDSLSRRILGDRWSVIHFPEHLVYFTRQTLEFALRRAGFETVWTTTTGISISRIQHAAKPPEEGKTVYSKSARSGDERLRKILEKSALAGLKSSLNKALDISSLGDSLKGGFQKPQS